MEQILNSYGFIGLTVGVLAAVIVFLYKELKAERKRNDTLSDSRISDARETRDKITEPLGQQAALTKQIYDLLINQTNRGN